MLWQKYDGSMETLPEKHRDVMLYIPSDMMSKYTAFAQGDTTNNPDQMAYFEPKWKGFIMRSWPRCGVKPKWAKVGSFLWLPAGAWWCHLPAPKDMEAWFNPEFTN
jgi:hypothetical protein